MMQINCEQVPPTEDLKNPLPKNQELLSSCTATAGGIWARDLFWAKLDSIMKQHHIADNYYSTIHGKKYREEILKCFVLRHIFEEVREGRLAYDYVITNQEDEYIAPVTT